MKKNKVACISGISGQIGYYLSNFLLEKDYDVYGIVRRLADRNIDYLDKRIKIINGDLADSYSINQIIDELKPDEFYSQGAQSHVSISFCEPEMTADTTGLSVLRILEAIRRYSPKTKLYQASTSELYGSSPAPQNENTPFCPNSPYAAAKLFAHNLISIYRQSYGLFACCGISFNMESPRRSKDFVTRKITNWIGQNYSDLIYFGKLVHGGPLELGNLDALRDWGSAKDHSEAMWLMLQNDKPEDFVIGTGKSNTVRTFVNEAFKCIGINIVWEGTGVHEVGLDSSNNQVLIKINPTFYRPLEVNHLEANANKIKEQLGWEPKMKFLDLVKWMVDSDIKLNNNPKNVYSKN